MEFYGLFWILFLLTKSLAQSNESGVFFVMCNFVTLISIYFLVLLSIIPQENIPEYNTLFTKKLLLQDASKNIELNISNNFSFFLIQVHTFTNKISLSNSSDFNPRMSITGNNIGLIQMNDSNNKKFYFYIRNFTLNQSIFIALKTYSSEDPVPGGCNLSFKTEIAPYQNVIENKNLIKIEAQASSVEGVLCEMNDIKLDFYYMYLDGYGYSSENFYKGIESMLTPEDIRRNGVKIENFYPHSRMIRFLSNYQGFGRVFCVIASYKNHSSSYVPIVSYGSLSLEKQLINRGKVQWIIISSLFCAFGFFISMFGTNYPSMTTFFIGFILYLSIIFAFFPLSAAGLLIIAIIPILPIYYLICNKIGEYNYIVHAILAGKMFAAMLFFSSYLGDTYAIHYYYWYIFFAVSFMASVLLFPFATFFISFVFLFIGLSIFSNGAEFYVLINVARQASVKNFNYAFIGPPTVTWIDILIEVGTLVICATPTLIRYFKRDTDPERMPLLEET